MRLERVEADGRVLPVPLEGPERQVADGRFGHRRRDLPRKHLLESDFPPPVRHSHTPFCGDRKAYRRRCESSVSDLTSEPWLLRASGEVSCPRPRLGTDFMGLRHRAGMSAQMSAWGRPLEAHFPVTVSLEPDVEPEPACTFSG